MKISELKKDSAGFWLVAQIIDKSPVREFQKFDQINYIAEAVIQDETGTISLTLWNEQANQFKVGDKIRIDKAYIKEWKGRLQVNSKSIVEADDEDLDEKFHMVPIGGKQCKTRQSLLH